VPGLCHVRRAPHDMIRRAIDTRRNQCGMDHMASMSGAIIAFYLIRTTNVSLPLPYTCQRPPHPCPWNPAVLLISASSVNKNRWNFICPTIFYGSCLVSMVDNDSAYTASRFQGDCDTDCDISLRPRQVVRGQSSSNDDLTLNKSCRPRIIV
jgi:hypothetical protein